MGKLAELRALASAATPWEDCGWSDEKDEFWGEYHDITGGGIFAEKDTAALMVACTPAVVLALVEAVEAAQAVCRRLDEARAWNVEHGRLSVVAEIDFAIGATLSLRAPLAPFTAETTSTLSAPCAREPLAPPKKHSEAGS